MLPVVSGAVAVAIGVGVAVVAVVGGDVAVVVVACFSSCFFSFVRVCLLCC